ncbi:MAG: hypothetical protein JJU36_06660 [Phycisphaeraceae bacterium]|nr:hypothetical protein [Phycisphaeraceae bacterium]
MAKWNRDSRWTICSLLALFLCSSAAGGQEPVIQKYLPDLRGSQKARLYIPPDTQVVRGLILDLGFAHAADRADFQAFARANDFAVLGTLLRWPPELKENIKELIAEFAKESGHPELVNVPWVPEAFSRSVGPAGTITVNHPERVLAMMSGGLSMNAREENLDNARRTAVMNVIGSEDPFPMGPQGVRDLRYFHEAWPRTRDQNLPWGCAIQWGAGHSHGTSMVMHAAFLKDIIALRMPGDHDPRTGPTPLRDMPPAETGWLGDIATWGNDVPNIVPVGDFTGDARKAHWMPGSYSAHVWRAYVVRQPRGEIRVDSQDDGRVTLSVDSGDAQPGQVTYYDGDRVLGRGVTLTTDKLREGLFCVYAVVQPANGDEGQSPRPYITRPVLVSDGRLVPLSQDSARPSMTAAALLEISPGAQQTLKALDQRAAYDGPGIWVERYAEDFSDGPGDWVLGNMGGTMKIVDNALQLESEGQTFAKLPRDFPREIAVEYRVRNVLDKFDGKLGPNSICLYINGGDAGRAWRAGAAFHFGIAGNSRSAWQVAGETDRGPPVTFTPNQWHNIRIQRIQRELTVTIDGKPFPKRIINDAEDRGVFGRRIGFHTVGSRVQMDSIKVYTWEPEDPADVQPTMPTADELATLARELIRQMDAPYAEQRSLAGQAAREYLEVLRPALEQATDTAGPNARRSLERLLGRP